jgi:hypothetical protein
MGRTAEAVGPASPHEGVPVNDPDFQAKLHGSGGINGRGYIPVERDVNIMARTLFTEFGNIDSWQDMPAGGWSIVNRIRPSERWPSYRNELGRSLREVLETINPNGTQQYSFMPRGGIDAPGGHRRWHASEHPEQLTGDDRKAWELADRTARAILGGSLSDPTGGAIFFRSRRAPEDEFWRSLVPSVYRSPRDENFIYHHPDEAPQPLRPQSRLIGDGSPRNRPQGPIRK